eukprot:gb/GEZN01015436.1/.p1 GENE.gb/GEZN01015436.1/~~gb/GEZN01015436.1/.p1  ORF type:complete len:237 (-),score=20.68 gb/GEZN01015436.1/:126-836(-)
MENEPANPKAQLEASPPPAKKPKLDEKDHPAAPGAGKPTLSHLTSFTVSHRGMKKYQQDRTVSLREEEVMAISPALNDTRYSFFAVYDGHGGEFCSKFLEENFHKNLFQELTKGLSTLRNSNPDVIKALEKRNKRSLRAEAIQKALITTCRATDQALLKICAAEKHEDGSCAVVVLVEGKIVWIANVGDSRTVMSAFWIASARSDRLLRFSKALITSGLELRSVLKPFVSSWKRFL